MLCRAIAQKEALSVIVRYCSTHVAVITNAARQKEEGKDLNNDINYLDLYDFTFIFNCMCGDTLFVL